MAATAVLLLLCCTTLPACPSDAGPQCTAELARVPGVPSHIAVSYDDTMAAVTAASGLHVYTYIGRYSVTSNGNNVIFALFFDPKKGSISR